MVFRIHTGVGHTDSDRVSIATFLTLKNSVFLVLLTGFKPSSFGSLVQRSNHCTEPTHHPTQLIVIVRFITTLLLAHPSFSGGLQKKTSGNVSPGIITILYKTIVTICRTKQHYAPPPPLPTYPLWHNPRSAGESSSSTYWTWPCPVPKKKKNTISITMPFGLMFQCLLVMLCFLFPKL